MTKLKIYPKKSFEEKVGFDAIRKLLQSHTRSSMGREQIALLQASCQEKEVKKRLEQIRELISLFNEKGDFPSLALSDLRNAIESIRPWGTYLNEEQLPQIALMIETIIELYRFLEYGKKSEEEEKILFPHIQELLPEGLLLPEISRSINELLDKFGRIKDNASSTLAQIRSERNSIERNISREVRRILSQAIQQGWADEDARPSLRDGHPVIPVNPSYKKSLRGIVHDESSSGKTVFIEPLEIVESNNKIRELNAAERKEIIRILTNLTDTIRPHIPSLLKMYQLIGIFDALFAIVLFSQEEGCVIPEIKPYPFIDWMEAKHPILRRSLLKENRQLIPINIHLSSPEKKILIISGPNAGGKSVCLKTAALLQYMLQMGIPIPVHQDSKAGIFRTLAINIGDDQSLEDDLSTYSSHLFHMQNFCKLSSPHTLFFIDEFGAGTEPELGGAIAEALLNKFLEAKSYAIITTHYRNLKQYASEHKGVVNGAMLYDRAQMKPLFQLAIGQPGSSFAIEIARKSGLPKEVIEYATQIVGKELINSDKFVQDIVRDKKYWEKKRDKIRLKEKDLEKSIEKYEKELAKIQSSKKDILKKAQDEAQALIKESNAKIEKTIREIKENNAEREKTIQVRNNLRLFSENNFTETESLDNSEEELKINRELEKIKRRQQRKAEKKSKAQNTISPNKIAAAPPPLKEGASVIFNNTFEGKLIKINTKSAIISLDNGIEMTVALEEIRAINSPIKKEKLQNSSSNVSDILYEKKMQFKQELDVRGMRSTEALQAVELFIDDAIQINCKRIRILHGTGTGALRMSIRQLLKCKPYIERFFDEDVRFGGAGITIVEL